MTNGFLYRVFAPESSFSIAPSMTLLPPSSLTASQSSPAVRRAKIVCTIGPATRSPKMVDLLMRAGMDVVRLNFSHGTPAEHGAAVEAVRAASARYEKPIAIIADLQGPKIRTGELEDGRPVNLRTGQRFIISTLQRAGNSQGVSTTYK